MLAIDFAGSGRSEGEYVTLGWWERDDVQAVVTALRQDPSVSAVALWGRSMGAATAILHSHRDPSIAGLVLDSPFADLRLLIDEIVADQKRVTGVSVPNWVLAILVRTIRSAVWKRTRCDIARLKPAADVDKSFIPALFAHGRDDTFIRPHHSRMIHDAYAGDKNIVMFSGGHNSPRPAWFQASAGNFLRQVLQQRPEHTLHDRAPQSLGSAWAAAGFRDLDGLEPGALAVIDAPPGMRGRAGAAPPTVGLGAGERAPGFMQEDEELRRALALSLAMAGGQVAAQPPTPPAPRRPGGAAAPDGGARAGDDPDLAQAIAMSLADAQRSGGGGGGGRADSPVDEGEEP